MIDIDHPASEPEPEVIAQRRLLSPPPTSPSVATSTNNTIARSDLLTKNGDEWSSPAFIKRARTSYGSLFDSNYDPFAEEDGTIRGKGRKRTRLSSTWRYSSRSPTPETAELEEASSTNTSPEPVLQPIPVMLDEGSQTIGLGVDDAVEALANFSRQATNVGSSLYPEVNESMFSESQAQQHGEDYSINHENAMPPPTIQTEIERDVIENVHAGQEAPPLPLLQPLSSDPLSVISPLASTGFTTPVLASQDGTLDQLAAPIEASHHSILDEQHEDLYSASPAGHCDEQHEDELHGFQDHAMDVNSRVHIPLYAQIATEDQYGHWQSENAKLSHFNSQHRVMEEAPDRLYVEEGLEGHYSHDGLPISSPDAQHVPQYPDLDEMPSQHITASWGPASAVVQYPDLPDANNQLENGSVVHPSLVRAPAMPRSQSAQSAIVDLTESDDDEEERELVDGSVDEEVDEGEEEEAEETPQDPIRRRYFTNIPRDEVIYSEDDVSQGSRSEDEFYKDEYEEEDEELRHPPGFYSRQGEDFDNEEDEQSYDEDMEDDEPPTRPPMQREPLVIDLLSSDDEDEGDTPQSPQVPPFQRPKPSPQAESSESEESDEYEGEEMEDTNGVPHAERSELRTVASQSFTKEASIEEVYKELENDEGEGRDEDADEDVQVAQQRQVSERGEFVGSSVAEEDLESEQLAVEEMEDGDDNLDADEKSEPSEQYEAQSVMPTAEKATEQQGTRPSKQGKSSLFARVFNLDGASDEPRFSYPSLPEDEDQTQETPPSDAEQRSQTSQDPQKQVNNQLPTPDMTQLSEKLPSANVSFSSTTGLQVPTEKSQSDLLGASATTEIEQPIMDDASYDAPIASGFSSRYIPIAVGVAPSWDGLPQTDQISLSSGSLSIGDDVKILFAEDPEDEGQIKDMRSAGEDTLVLIAYYYRRTTVLKHLRPRELPKMKKSWGKSDGLFVPSTHHQVLRLSEVTFSPQHPDFESKVNRELLFDLFTRKILRIGEEKPDDEAVTKEDEVEVNPNANSDEAVDAEQPVGENGQVGGTENDGIADLTQPPKASIDTAGPETESITEETVKGTINGSDVEMAQDGIVLEVATTSVPEIQNGELEQGFQEPTELSQEAKTPSPRRSHRRGRSAASNVEVPELARPVTPAKSRVQVEIGSARTDRSYPLIIDSQATPNGHDASIELAISALDSPSKQLHDLRRPPAVDAKLRLSRALRNDLREFTALKVLRYHLTQKLDVLAVATTTPPEPQRAKGGPRHYSITFNITDPSIAPVGVTQVQVSRPYKEALPIVKAGDGILLRNFEVIAVKNRGFGLRSDDPSSWAVFRDNEEIETRGPPVEFQGGEKKYVTDLKAWYGSLDETALVKLNRANTAKETATGVGGKGVGKGVLG